jgi:ADP-heptose:LPS heptosyltransferase
LFLGDMLCVIPVVRAIRAYYPDAHITLIGLSWQEDLVKRFDRYFNDFIEFPGWPGLPEKPYDAAECLRFTVEMQKKKFDLVLQMQGNGILTNSMCLLWNAGITTGLRKPGDFWADEKLFPLSDDDEHEVLRFLKLLDALDIPRSGSHLEFPLTQDEEAAFASGASKHALFPQHYICIHPGSRDPKRRWPARYFASIADQLIQLGYTVILTGSRDEKDVIQSVAGLMTGKPIKSSDIFPAIELGNLASLIKYAALLISNDTGVSHIAAGLSIPSVVLFSRYSRQSRWAPENSVLHKVIPFEHSQDLPYVWSHVQRQLRSVSAVPW